MSILLKVFALACGLPLLFGLAACAVGPGTPLVDALQTKPGQGNTSVPGPKGYGPPIQAGETYGLINPKQREATEAYLESLASQ
ncbi:hypothetical protein [Roseibium marinum]|uniref:Lipoprotein n=1 Tax=Roseibium marinum TaxID=281252 RepID=A0A2S3UJ78_9HYPH|nr:hypothetical protein [Roseibium marinum]POF27705.1 hypothetical protein CLV41_1234 [Roseibium marinum]